jgi:hypothetical protein
MSVAYGWFDTELTFDDALDLQVEQHMLVAGLGYAFEDGWRLGGSIGVTLHGALRGVDHRLAFQPGFVATVQAGVTVFEADGWMPFVESTVSVSVSSAAFRDSAGEERPWTALDLRLGATSGWLVYGFWVPYVALRFFGGPVFWADGAVDRVGTDRHHYQLAIGSTFTFAGVEIFVDWGLPLGEAGLSAGAGYRF